MCKQLLKLTLVLLLTVTQLNGITVSANWAKAEGNVVYIENSQLAKGWKWIDNNWYYFNRRSGYMMKGWLYDSGCWYFLDYQSGAMKRGWVADGKAWYYLNPENGIMMSKRWIEENGKRYYVNETGMMATGFVMIDGKMEEFDSSGVYLNETIDTIIYEGWVENNHQKSYYRQGKRVSGWQTIDGIEYFFDEGGIAINGWYEMDHEKTYFIDGMPVTLQMSDESVAENIYQAVSRFNKRLKQSEDKKLNELAMIRANELLLDFSNIRPDHSLIADSLDEKIKDSYEILLKGKDVEDCLSQLSYAQIKHLKDDSFDEAVIGYIENKDGMYCVILLVEKKQQ